MTFDRQDLKFAAITILVMIGSLPLMLFWVDAEKRDEQRKREHFLALCAAAHHDEPTCRFMLLQREQADAARSSDEMTGLSMGLLLGAGAAGGRQ